MEDKKRKMILNILIKLDSILEILTLLQLIDFNLEQFKDVDITDYLELPIEGLKEIKSKIEDF